MPDVFELIQRLCPDGVEYNRLGDVCDIKRGGSFQKKDYVSEGFPCIHYGQIYTHYGSYVTETISFLSYACADEQKKAVCGDIIMAVTSENLQDVCKCLVWLGTGEVAVSGHAVIITPCSLMNSKYLSYYFRSSLFETIKPRLVKGIKVIDLSLQLFANVVIPIPPLPVQEEIVRILDAFDTYCNDMTAGLAGELEMRRKQFQYWREKLIDQYQDCNAVLGNFFTQVSRKAGANFPKERLRVVSNTMGLVSKDDYEQRTQDASEDLSNYKLVGSGEFVYNPRRLHVGSVAYNKESDNVAVSPAYQVFSVEGIHPDYLMHLFRRSRFDRQREKYTEKGAGVKFTFDKFQYVSMPVPPMDVQLEIVAVLNKFQELEKELEKELELRKKQFEYYRDKLLTFPALESRGDAHV